jgi:short-subunit dehydrogenase
MQISEKVVLITGASEGIGAACVQAFRDRGARIALTARSCEKLQRLAHSGDAVVRADLYNREERVRLIDTVLQQFGRIDILVNNAGVALYSPAWNSPEEETRRMFELNFFAPLHLSRLVAPHMRKRNSGCIVNVSSIAGKVTLPWFTLYSASKYAICSLTDGLRMELAPAGVHVMAVCPAYVSTRFQQNIIGPGRVPERLARSSTFRITAQECARALVRGVERRKRTVVVPGSAWLFIAFARLFPGLLDSQLIRYQAGGGQA